MSKLIPVITLLNRLQGIPRGRGVGPIRQSLRATLLNSAPAVSPGTCSAKMSAKEVGKVHHLLRSVIKLESLVVQTINDITNLPKDRVNLEKGPGLEVTSCATEK